VKRLAILALVCVPVVAAADEPAQPTTTPPEASVPQPPPEPQQLPAPQQPPAPQPAEPQPQPEPQPQSQPQAPQAQPPDPDAATVEDLADDVDDLDDRMKRLERQQRTIDAKLQDIEAMRWLKRYINVYVDIGAFAVGGNGSGIRSDIGHLYYPKYMDRTAGQWVFMGDQLAGRTE
jgi:hypothetical protein